jgi:hypothetical protein
MFDRGRLRPHARIGAGLVLAGMAIAAAFQVLGATPALGWLPRVVSGPGFLQDNRERVAGALRQYEEGEVRPDEPLCSIIGLSTVREGIDLGRVSAEAGVGCRFLGLAGAGMMIPDMVPHAEILLASPLQPDLVILGIGPYQLLDPKPGRGPSQPPGIASYLRRGDLRNAATEARNALWIYARRRDVSLTAEAALLEARARLFHAFRVRLGPSVEGPQGPWRDMLKTIQKDHFSEATLREEEQFFEGLGTFDPRAYARGRRAAAALIDLVRRFRDRGAAVVLVLMPESSRLRRRMPPEASRALEAALGRAFPGSMPPILDLRDAVEDAGFVDLAHLNHAGCLRCSRRLAEAIRRYLPRHPPLMKGSPVVVDRRREAGSR